MWAPLNSSFLEGIVYYVLILTEKGCLYMCMHSSSRFTGILPAVYINQVKCLTSQASGPPKRPLNGYMRYVMQQQPVVTRQNPGASALPTDKLLILYICYTVMAIIVIYLFICFL